MDKIIAMASGPIPTAHSLDFPQQSEATNTEKASLAIVKRERQLSDETDVTHATTLKDDKAPAGGGKDDPSSRQVCACCGAVYSGTCDLTHMLYCSDKCYRTASAAKSNHSIKVKKEGRKSKSDAKPVTGSDSPIAAGEDVGISDKLMAYKSTLVNLAAPDSCFSAHHLQLAREVKELKPGMKLEALDKNNPCNYCIATVIEVSGHRVRIRYDGFGKDTTQDFWCDFQAEELFPIGWCASNGYPLQPPAGIKSSLEEWKTFLTNTLTGALAAPVELFRESHRRIPRKVHSFQTGMTVECVHPAVPSVVCIGVITKSLGPYYYVISAEATKNTPAVSFCAHYESPLIFPIGWCKKHDIPLTLSTTAISKGLSIDQVLVLCESKAAPPTALYKSPKLCKFNVGQKLETVDMEEPSIIRTATVYNVLGRVIQVMFDGIVKFQFTDCESQSLYPIGWCAQTGHQLTTAHGIAVVNSPFRLPSRGVGSISKTIQKLSASDSPSLFPLPSFRSVVERYHASGSKVFFNKNCYFGEHLIPRKVMDASSCTMPSRPTIVLRRTLERLLCVSKMPDKLAQIIQEGMDPKVIIRGKVVKKNLQQYDTRANAIKFLKLLCRRLGCCEYFLSFDFQYCNECPLQCKRQAFLNSGGNSTEGAGNAQGQESGSMPTGSTASKLQRQILPSSLQPTLPMGRPSPMPGLPVSLVSGDPSSSSSDPTSAITTSNVPPKVVATSTIPASRFVIGNAIANDPRFQLVANRLRNSIQNSKLNAPTSTVAATTSSGQQRPAANRVSTLSDPNVRTLLIMNNPPGSETTDLSPVHLGRPPPYTASIADEPVGSRQVCGTLVMNSSSPLKGDLPPGGIVETVLGTSNVNGENASLSVPSTVLIHPSNINGGRLVLRPVQLPGNSTISLTTTAGGVSIPVQSAGPTTLMSSSSGADSGLISQWEHQLLKNGAAAVSAPPPTYKFHARSSLLQPGRYSVVSTQHSQARRGLPVAPPANGVVRSPLQPMANLRHPSPISLRAAPTTGLMMVEEKKTRAQSPLAPSPLSTAHRVSYNPNEIPMTGFPNLTFVSASSNGTEGGSVLRPLNQPALQVAHPTHGHGNSLASSLALSQLDGHSGGLVPSDHSQDTERHGAVAHVPNDSAAPITSTNSVSVAYVSLQSNSKDKIMYVPLRPGVGGLNHQLLLYQPTSSVRMQGRSNNTNHPPPDPAALSVLGRPRHNADPRVYYGGKIIPTTNMTSFRIQGNLVGGVAASDGVSGTSTVVQCRPMSLATTQQHGHGVNLVSHSAGGRITSVVPLLPKPSHESRDALTQPTRGADTASDTKLSRYPVWRRRKRKGVHRRFTRKKGATNQKQRLQYEPFIDEHGNPIEGFDEGDDDEDDDDEDDSADGMDDMDDPEPVPRQGSRKRNISGSLVKGEQQSAAMANGRRRQTGFGRSLDVIRIDAVDRRVRQPSFLVDPMTRVELPIDPEQWTSDEVAQFIEATDCPVHADDFRTQEIDGKALLLLTREALMDFAGFKLGPALKVCSYIAQLKTRLRQNHPERS